MISRPKTRLLYNFQLSNSICSVWHLIFHDFGALLWRNSLKSCFSPWEFQQKTFFIFGFFSHLYPWFVHLWLKFELPNVLKRHCTSIFHCILDPHFAKKHWFSASEHKKCFTKLTKIIWKLKFFEQSDFYVTRWLQSKLSALCTPWRSTRCIGILIYTVKPCFTYIGKVCQISLERSIPVSTAETVGNVDSHMRVLHILAKIRYREHVDAVLKSLFNAELHILQYYAICTQT